MDSFKELDFSVPDWLKRIEEEYKEEVNDSEQSVFPMKLMKMEARLEIWYMSQLFGVERNGVPGLACRLLERYLLAKLYDSDYDTTDLRIWRRYYWPQVPRITLWMASCIQLAGKMSSSGVDLRPSKIQYKLANQGLNYNKKDIIATEQEIYKTLDFRIPLWTSVEIAEILASEIQVEHRVLQSVHKVIDVSEMRRDWLNSKIQWVANLSTSSNFSSENVSRIRTTHLAAASVVATERYHRIDNPDSITRLAKLTQAPVSYIKSLTDIVLSIFLHYHQMP